MDGQFVENIVHEVKSQGVFDEFRRDSMADVDTKPAYQNLRQRVDNTVKKFLSEQKWTPDTNKNQLREKLRRHITESGFLDVGVERIVDQVVNPKIGSVFQPRIEEIAYNYLGLPPPPKKYEQPPPPLMHPLPPLPLNAPPLQVETSSLLPTDLEQVSPESDKGTVKFEEQRGDVSISITVFDMETDDKTLEDEDESPPFEPLVKQEIKEEKEDMQVEKREENEKIKEERNKSLLEDKKNMVEDSNDASIKVENLLTDNDSRSNFANDTAAIDKDTCLSIDARISQDSQLSSVSSDSRLSANGKEDSLQNSSSQEAVAANISEEAQMPKFNENSSEVNNDNSVGQNEKYSKTSELHFDIKKDEIKFEGTERKCALDTQELAINKTEEIKYTEAQKNATDEIKNESFKFSSNSNLEVKLENVQRTPNNQDSSFGSSIDDSSSVPANCTPKTSIGNKELSTDKNSLLIQTPKQQISPTAPNTTPIPTPTMPTPTATPSPITSYKAERDQSSRHSSSSSSKHKKHSKERRRSHDREKDKDRYRSSKDYKESSSKYSGSSASKSSKISSSYPSKSSSSHNKSAEKDFEKSSSSSTYSSSKHSKHSQSSSSNDHNDTKNRKRDADRRHHSSSSSHKEHSSSAKRSERKDDHTEAKNKIQRRKTTDSNDDDGDKSLGGRTSSQYRSYNPSRSALKPSNTKSNNDNNQSPNTKANDHSQLQTFSNEEFLSKTQLHGNVVILNDLLENPQIQCIQLDKTGHLIENPMIEKSFTNSFKNKKSLEFNNNNEYPNTKGEEFDSNTCLELFYFKESLTDYNERLELFDKTIDLCRSAVNSLRFDSTSDNGIVLSNKEDLQTNKSNLLMETLKIKPEMNYEEYEKTPRKRNASTESKVCLSKTSPTPSDSSVNSKENEEIDKNIDLARKSSVDRPKAVQKLSQQQRYSSEDLYKPRPILGQRSRRRGMDSLV